MAQRTTVLLVDDLDGSQADETVEFELDGTTYEIDLSTTHAGALRDALAGYVAGARRTAGRRSVRPAPQAGTGASTAAGGSSAAEREQNRAVRAWANEHGYTLSARGRIPSVVTEAYRKGDPSALVPAEPAENAAFRPVEVSDDASLTSAHAPEPVTAPSSAADGADDNADDKLGPDGLTRTEREHIRAWAQEQGIEVKARGRLTRDLIANYRATTARTGHA